MIGASVDAMVILGFNVLTAAQTGNTVLLAVAIARGDLLTGASAATSVTAFVLGCLLGECVIGCMRRLRMRDLGILPVLLLELLLLATLLLVWSNSEPVTGGGTQVVVALAALTMGLQSAAALHARSPATTYMTGMLATFSTGFASWISTLLSTDSKATNDPHQPGDPQRTRAAFPWRNGVGWVIYLAGAILCGILFLRVGAMALLMPIGISLVLLGLHLQRPN
nr:YoaK family protein [Thiocapsa imhoffii]